MTKDETDSTAYYTPSAAQGTKTTPGLDGAYIQNSGMLTVDWRAWFIQNALTKADIYGCGAYLFPYPAPYETMKQYLVYTEADKKAAAETGVPAAEVREETSIKPEVSQTSKEPRKP